MSEIRRPTILEFQGLTFIIEKNATIEELNYVTTTQGIDLTAETLRFIGLQREDLREAMRQGTFTQKDWAELTVVLDNMTPVAAKGQDVSPHTSSFAGLMFGLVVRRLYPPEEVSRFIHG